MKIYYKKSDGSIAEVSSSSKSSIEKDLSKFTREEFLEKCERSIAFDKEKNHANSLIRNTRKKQLASQFENWGTLSEQEFIDWIHLVVEEDATQIQYHMDDNHEWGDTFLHNAWCDVNEDKTVSVDMQKAKDVYKKHLQNKINDKIIRKNVLLISLGDNHPDTIAINDEITELSDMTKQVDALKVKDKDDEKSLNFLKNLVRGDQ